MGNPKTERIADVFAMAVPEQFDPAIPEDRVRLIEALDPLSERYVAAQYEAGAPKALMFEPTDWLITKDPVDVERFQPVHDCAVCRAGNDQAVAFLAEHPGRYIAMANLIYVEVWT